MLYLADFIEAIEDLPQQFNSKLTSVRELDLRIIIERDKYNKSTDYLFKRAATLPGDVIEEEFNRLTKEYEANLIKHSEEKIQIANELKNAVEKYKKRIYQELHKFKLELEADNAGITAHLEKRVIDNENARQIYREKRKAFSRYDNENSANVNGCLKFNPNKLAKNATSYNAGLDDIVNVPVLNTKLMEKNQLNNNNNSNNNNNKVNLTGQSAIAAAASQAIAATQQLSFGRRSASLRASYEAINNSPLFSSFCNLTSKMDDLNENSMDWSKSKKTRIKKRSSSANYVSEENEDSSETVTSEKYCYCQGVSSGPMIFCENLACPYEWFHYDCVKIRIVPEGPWYCPTCKKDNKCQQPNDE